MTWSRYSLNGAMAAQDGARAGCDSGCSVVYHSYGMQAVAEGLITEREANASVRRLLRPHFELGARQCGSNADCVVCLGV
jgi:beta-glucosidase-like glycosyl hydrolase